MSTVYGIDNMMVGKIDTRATNQICSRTSRQANGRRTNVTNDSALNIKNSPSAFMGFARVVPFIVLARPSGSPYGSTRSPSFVTTFIRL